MSHANKNLSSADSGEIHRLVESAQEMGRPDRYTGKRQWMRFAAGMRLQITTNRDDPSASTHVTMQNVSEGGFAFWSKRDLPQHTIIFVREYSDDGTNEWVAAAVRHCTSGIRGFLVGAQFECYPGEE